MKIYYYLIIFFLFINCSFDNKSGIWENQNTASKKSKDQFSQFKDISSTKEAFDKIIDIDKKFVFKTSNIVKSKSWTDKNYNEANELKNFYYNDRNKLLSKSKKISRFDLNEYFLVEENNFIVSDKKGNLIIGSLDGDKRKIKFNFYKKKFKNKAKILYKIIENNIIYVSDNLGYLYAYNYIDNNLLWAKNYKIPFRSNLKIANNKLIGINQNNEMLIFDKKNGEKINSIPTEEVVLKNNFLSNISLSKDNIFFLNTFGSLYSINLKSMQIDWFLNLNQSMDPDDNYLFDGTELIYKNEKLIVLTNDFTYIIDSLTGGIIYKINFSSSINPIIINNYLFTITKNDLLIAFDIDLGKIIYSYNINQLVSNFTNTKKKNIEIKYLIQANNKLLIFLKNSYIIKVNLYGEISKIDKLPSKITSNPIIIKGSILYINNNNKVSIVD